MVGVRHIRLVVAIDGTHLKEKYKEVMFIVSWLNGKEQIFPLAFSIGNIGNMSSWFFE